MSWRTLRESDDELERLRLEGLQIQSWTSTQNAKLQLMSYTREAFDTANHQIREAELQKLRRERVQAQVHQVGGVVNDLWQRNESLEAELHTLRQEGRQINSRQPMNTAPGFRPEYEVDLRYRNASLEAELQRLRWEGASTLVRSDYASSELRWKVAHNLDCHNRALESELERLRGEARAVQSVQQQHVRSSSIQTCATQLKPDVRRSVVPWLNQTSYLRSGEVAREQLLSRMAASQLEDDLEQRLGLSTARIKEYRATERF